MCLLTLVLTYLFHKEMRGEKMNGTCSVHRTNVSTWPLSPARWHSKYTYLSCLGMLGTIQLNSFFFFFFEDHITFNIGYMERSHTRQRMTNINNNNTRKQV